MPCRAPFLQSAGQVTLERRRAIRTVLRDIFRAAAD